MLETWKLLFLHFQRRDSKTFKSLRTIIRTTWNPFDDNFPQYKDNIFKNTKNNVSRFLS